MSDNLTKVISPIVEDLQKLDCPPMNLPKEDFVDQFQQCQCLLKRKPPSLLFHSPALGFTT